MLILPLIDLLILAGTVCLVVGFGLKAIDITTHYRPMLMGFTSMDLVVMTGVCWGFALTLAARAWVKINEPLLFQRRREQIQARAMAKAHAYDLANGNGNGNGDENDPAAPRLS